MLTAREIEYIQAAPKPGVEFEGLNRVLKWPGWDNVTNTGWLSWSVERSLIAKGVLIKTRGGRGRGNKNHFMLKAL